MASKAERDARLDQLEAATKTWATNRRKELEGQVSLAKRMLKGRKGSERLNNHTINTASDLLVDEISTFLTG